MGLEKLWKKSRVDRLADPDITRGLAAEHKRFKESVRTLGNQTKETCTSILYNTVVKPFVRVKNGGKREFDPVRQITEGAFDSTAKVALLVGRILFAAGRSAKYAVRKSAVL